MSLLSVCVCAYTLSLKLIEFDFRSAPGELPGKSLPNCGNKKSRDACPCRTGGKKAGNPVSFNFHHSIFRVEFVTAPVLLAAVRTK